jgi:pimeloyl-ACP methyl ester carboxylesterase
MENPIDIGGECGMGMAVSECLNQVARSVPTLFVKGAGHYPAEQQPAVVNEALVEFFRAIL